MIWKREHLAIINSSPAIFSASEDRDVSFDLTLPLGEGRGDALCSLSALQYLAANFAENEIQ